MRARIWKHKSEPEPLLKEGLWRLRFEKLPTALHDKFIQFIIVYAVFYEAVSKKHQNLFYMLKKWLHHTTYSALEDFLLPIV